MAEGPILSPDGKHVLVNGEWLELSQQNVSLTDSVISGDVSMSSTVNINTRSASEEITNLADLALLKLTNGQMASFNEIYLEAKKINVDLAIEIFENEYSLLFGKAYVDLTEHYASECLGIRIRAFGTTLVKNVTTAPILRNEKGENKVTLRWPESVSITGHERLPSLHRQMMIAANNAKSFLGDGKDIKNLTGESFTETHREKLKQTYRLCLIVRAVNEKILLRTNEIDVLLPYGHRWYRTFFDLRMDARPSGFYYYLDFIENWDDFFEIHYKSNPTTDWNDEYSYLIYDGIFSSGSESSRQWKSLKKEHEWWEKPKWNDDCFIATAAYGTPFAKDIDILRMWRDNKLQSSFLGRKFVKIYYSFLGPFLARIISKSVILKYITRQLLKPVVYIVGKGKEDELRIWLIRRSDFD